MLTAAQIVSLATQAAKVPGWTDQAGKFLNTTLQDLCENYDLDCARGTISVLLNGTKGPFALPNDYLRVRQREGATELYYVINGVPYYPVQRTFAELNTRVYTPGLSNFPQEFATDFTNAVPFVTGPSLYVWPPSNGAYTLLGGYQKQMPDITTPESSSTIPWFPNTNYLWTNIAGLLMKLNADSRWEAYLSDNEREHPGGSGVLLRNYLELKDDNEGMTKTVSLDRRRFRGNAMRDLRNTKTVGW